MFIAIGDASKLAVRVRDRAMPSRVTMPLDAFQKSRHR